MSSRSLNDLRPSFRTLVEAWLADCEAEGYTILITCTLRPGFEQDQLFEIGRTVMGRDPIPVIRPMGRKVTNARAGESAHGFGLGVDYTILVAGKPDWSGNSPAWNRTIELAEKHGLQSLRPMESAHLQDPAWKLKKDQQDA